MNRALTVTYEKSNEGIPTLCVTENGLFYNAVLKVFTGEKAEWLYKELTGQNVVIKMESEDDGK